MPSLLTLCARIGCFEYDCKLQTYYKVWFPLINPTVPQYLPVMRFICRLPRLATTAAQETAAHSSKKQLTALTNGKLCRAALINRSVCSGL